MANSYKNIVITPNISNTADPKIVFSGGNTTVNTDISMFVYPASNGTLSFEGSAGQLFSITNDLTGSIFSVNDVSGIPSIEVFANGQISLAPYGGNVVFGATSTLRLNTLQFANSSTNGPYFTYGNNQENLYFRGGSTATTQVGLSLFDGNNNWRVQIYGNSDGYGFLNGNWNVWDFRKIPSGNLFLNNQSTYYIGTSEIYYNRVYGVTDIRSPIFYDQDNTAYYINGASTSNINALTVVGALTATSAANHFNGHFYFDAYDAAGNHYPHFNDGTNNSGVKVNWRLYTGASLTATHTWTTSAATFATTLASSVDVRAPIFYDSNNTAHYLDPASTTTSLQIAGAIEQGNDLSRPNIEWSGNGTTTGMVIFSLPGAIGNYGMVHMVFDVYEYVAGKTATVIIGGHNWNGAWYEIGCQVIGNLDKLVRLGFKDGKYCVVFGSNVSTWTYGTIRLRKIHNGGFYGNIMDLGGAYTAVQTTTESFTVITADLRNLRTPGTFQADSDVRAPIFYDSNNTAYYTDPASTSNLNGLTVAGVITGTAQYTSDGGRPNLDNYANFRVIRNNNSTTFNDGMYIGFGNTNSGLTRIYGGGSTTAELIKYSNYTYEPGSFRAPIFYDSDNTAYYVDATGTTVLNGLSVSGINAGSIGWNSIVPVFGQRAMYLNELVDVLYQADKRFTLTNGEATYFDGNFDSSIIIPVNTTRVININLAGQSGIPASGITYCDGVILVSFYYTENNYSSLSLRVRNNAGTWTTASAPTNISTGANYKVMAFNVPIGNYLTDIELTVVTNATNQVWLASINYYCTRWTTELELPYVSKYLLNNYMFGNFGVKTNAGVINNLLNGTGNSYLSASAGNVGIGNASPSHKLDVTGTARATVDFRAPIFYDVDNTAYYTDPFSTSAMSYINVFGDWFDTNSTTWGGGINLKGTQPSLGFQDETATTWFMLHQNNTTGGVVKYHRSTSGSWVNDGFWHTTGYELNYVSYRAPIFYDADNTTYYMDPATGTNLNGTFTNNGGTAMTGSWNRSMLLNATFPVVVFNSNNTKYSGIGVDHSDAASGFRFWVNGSSTDISGTGTIAMSINTGNFVTAFGSFRAPIFYDSADTTYYLDPASTGNSLLGRGNGVFGYGNLTAGADYGIAIYHGSDAAGYGRIRFYQNNSNHATIHAFSTSWGSSILNSRGAINFTSNLGVTIGAWDTIGTNGHYFDMSGNGQSSVSFRSPIFYDSNNTAFYGDFATITNLNDLAFNGRVVWNTSDSTDNGLINLGYLLLKRGNKLYTDEDFNRGFNGVSVYNNLGGTALTASRVSDATAPNSSRQILRFTYNGGSNGVTPGLGGFFFGVSTSANRILVCTFKAKLPSGYSFEWASNGIGTNSNSYWVTSNTGTGKYEEYAYVVICGNTGGFSTTHFFYVNGSTPANGTILFDIASATVWDITDNNQMNMESIRTAVDMRAPIFYDADNTAYYADPASTSVFNTVNAIDFNSTSDIRYKRDIYRIENALEKINQLNGYTFTMIENNERSTGLIAQELEAVLPEAVKGDAKKTIAYGNVLGLFVEAMKEQNAKIEKLEALIEKLINKGD